MGVSENVLGRWETGVHKPSPLHEQKIKQFLRLIEEMRQELHNAENKKKEAIRKSIKAKSK